MQGPAGWTWKALIVSACVGYQVLAHSVVHDAHAGLIRVALAAIPLLVLAWWIVRSARHKLIWTLALSCAATAVYLIEQYERLGLAATNALTHTTINLAMLWLFGRTLLPGREPLITRFARRIHGTLTAEIELYTRRVTLLWCVFFAAQIVVSALLFAFSTLEAWSLFVNLLSLPLIAVTFVGEYAYRILRYRSHDHVSILKGMQIFIDDARRKRRRPLAS
jgi:uncharacterized membrane protein